MEIQDCFKYAERAEENASKMQVTSVSEELNSRLSSSVSNNESSTSMTKQSSEGVTNLPSQSMETTTRETRQANFDPTRAPQKKAKLIRKERKINKLFAQGKTQEEINTIMNRKRLQSNGKTVEELFNELSGDYSNKLEVRIYGVIDLKFGWILGILFTPILKFSKLNIFSLQVETCQNIPNE